MSNIEPAPDLPGADHRAPAPAWIETPNRVIRDPRTRAYLYGVLVALIPALVVLGVIVDEQAAVWLNVAAAVLAVGGFGTAAANTPSGRDPGVDG